MAPSRAAGRLERLEPRLLLRDSPLAAEGLAGWPLAIEPAAYAADRILVRYREPAAAESPAPAFPWAPPGASGQTAFGAISGLWQIQLAAGTSVEQALAAYRARADVLYAEPDYRVHLALEATDATPSDPRYDELWGLDNTGQTGGLFDADIDAPRAWDVARGSGSTVVAVIDTGIDYTHPDLAANIWLNELEIPADGLDNDGNGYVDDVHGYDFVNRDGDPLDDHNHGTHVAGTIGAVGDNGLGVTGVNWNVRLMALKFLDHAGSGSLSDAIAAIDYAVRMGAAISNNSWGANDEFSQALQDAISAARDAGHIFVAAAGNGFLGIPLDNDSNPFYPANYDLDNIVAVAATDHNDQLGSFSNYGATTVDLGAPGVNILSTTRGGGYAAFDGTSMATPHVAGVLALVRDQHSDWTYSQVIAQVLSTVDPVDALAGKTVTGGRLNAAAAVGNPEPPPPSTTLPVIEDFDDGAADFFQPRAGSWQVQEGRYAASPGSSGGDAVATLRLVENLEDSLPADLELRSVVQMDPATGSDLSNAFIIFDYQRSDDFKFAGAYAGADRWLIGRRTPSGWLEDATFSEPIDAATDYALQVILRSGRVQLVVDGIEKLAYDFTDLLDGAVGLGTRSATSRFDNLLVQAFVPPPAPPAAELPLAENFDDGLADYFDPRTSGWSVQAGRYHASPPAGSDAASTLRLAEPLPNDVEIEATINVNQAAGSYLSNAFIIFDYQGPTDFKFAGAYAGAGRWLIGRRTASGWLEDATVSETIAAGRDYRLHLRIDQQQKVTLSVDGAARLAYTFSGSVHDGLVGLATRSAVSRFDDLLVREYLPPPPPPQASLPMQEDFQDGLADYFQVQTGTWNVAGGRYHASPISGGDAVSTVRLADPLPADVDLAAIVNADPASGSYFSNALVIFDYHGPTDFKFAGAYVGAGRWLIGRRTASGWLEDAKISDTIAAGRDYRLRLVIEGTKVTLHVDGAARLAYTYADSVHDGLLGVGTRNALSHFDDVVVQEYVPPPPPPEASLPVTEDFDDGLADYFQVQSGTWNVAAGRYHASPISGGDAISTVRLAEPVPADVDLSAIVNADSASGTSLSNALLIFDYRGPTDFKFAGAYVGAGRWVIGRRTSSGWLEDARLSQPITAGKDYRLLLALRSGHEATLYVDGVAKLSFTFSDALTDGAIGIGTRNAVSHFDDVQLTEPPSSLSLQTASIIIPLTDSDTAPLEPLSAPDSFLPVGHPVQRMALALIDSHLPPRPTERHLRPRVTDRALDEIPSILELLAATLLSEDVSR